MSESAVEIRTTQTQYLSHDGKTLVHAVIWYPAGADVAPDSVDVAVADTASADVDFAPAGDAPAGADAAAAPTDAAPAAAAAGAVPIPAADAAPASAAPAPAAAPSIPQAPRGVVQLVHGMSEYIERYDDFARFLVANGFIVCANDHIGHGQSVLDKSDWGNLPLDGGAETLVEDVHSLRTYLTHDLGVSAPYFLFGHSMGSFVTRAYLARHAAGLSGAVLCGTGFVPAATAKAGLTLARAMGKLRGGKAKSKLLNQMADGAYSKAIPNARTPFDWLNTDPAAVDAYIADDACGFLFTIGGYATLMSLLVEVNTPSCPEKWPKDLPVFFIAGGQDPVGSNGEGVRTVARMTIDAGIRDVNIKIYEQMRHEILNEPAHAEVYNDVLMWLDQKLDRA